MGQLCCKTLYLLLFFGIFPRPYYYSSTSINNYYYSSTGINKYIRDGTTLLQDAILVTLFSVYFQEVAITLLSALLNISDMGKLCCQTL